MKTRILYWLLVFTSTLLGHKIFAQAPNISYSTPTNIYTIGTAITPLTPTNTGGAVTTGTFSSTSVSGPSGMGISPSSNLYVTQYNSGTITYYSSSGTYLGTFGTGFTNPDGIAFDSSGNAYIVDTGSGKIYKITTGGVQTTLITGLGGPFGIGIDGSGNIYVTDTNNNQVIKYANTGGAALLTITTNLSSPSDVRVDASGNIYVLNLGSGNVTKYNSAGVYLTTFASGFNSPFAIAISSTGSVYVCDSGNNLVDIYNSSGTLLNTISVTDPEGIVVDAAGDVFISSYSSNKIYEYPPLGGYVITGVLPAGLSFNTTTGTISGTPTVSSVATNYTITAYNGSGSSSTTISIACGVSVIWYGKTNSTWTTGSNWSTNSPPSTSDIVSIGVSNYRGTKAEPVLTTAITVGSVTFGNSGGINHTLTITSPGTLNIGSYLTVPTGISPTVTGTGAVNILPAAVVNITGTGALTISSPLTFTLQSDATGSATIGQITTGSITGTVSVQRYLSGGQSYSRGYRAISSPVYNSTSGGNNIYSINYVKLSALTTGIGGPTGGFDKTGNPTFYIFRDDVAISNNSFISGNLRGVTDISLAPSYSVNIDGSGFHIPVGNGFFFFDRGDRTSQLAIKYLGTTIAESITLTASGTLNVGPITVHPWFTPSSANLDYTAVAGNSTVLGYALVGNPYASSIDWDKYSTTAGTGIYAPSVGKFIYVYNPANRNFNVYQSGFSGIGTLGNNSNIIPSGEGFYVRATSSSAQLVFNEDSKTNTQANTTNGNLYLGKPIQDEVVQYLHLMLIKDNDNKDGTIISFKSSAKPQFDANEDATYRPGNGILSLSTTSADSLTLAFDELPLPGKTHLIIPLNVNAYTDGVYKLYLDAIKSVPDLYDVWLMDAYQKDSLDIKHNPTYSFDITRSVPATYGSTRFSLVIRQNQAKGVHLLNFTASKIAGGSQVTWKTENEQNYTYFTVERSTNGGITFDVIGSVTSSAQGTYSFLDKAPVKGTDKYRLKIEDLNGTISYSQIVSLDYGDSKNNSISNIIVYPNPVGNTINLSIILNNGSTNKLSYGIKVINITGSVVKTGKTNTSAWQENADNLAEGTYIIQVINNNDNSLVGKTTFIKL